MGKIISTTSRLAGKVNFYMNIVSSSSNHTGKQIITTGQLNSTILGSANCVCGVSELYNDKNGSR